MYSVSQTGGGKILCDFEKLPVRLEEGKAMSLEAWRGAAERTCLPGVVGHARDLELQRFGVSDFKN